MFHHLPRHHLDDVPLDHLNPSPSASSDNSPWKNSQRDHSLSPNTTFLPIDKSTHLNSTHSFDHQPLPQTLSSSSSSSSLDPFKVIHHPPHSTFQQDVHHPIQSSKPLQNSQNIHPPRPLSSPSISASSKRFKRRHLPSIFRLDNIFIRWFFFITPILLLIWIPSIVEFILNQNHSYPHLKITGVSLIFWSSWLSVAWLGWWVGLIIGWIIPKIFKHIIGIGLHPNFVDRWSGYLLNLNKPIMAVVWSFSTWLGFNVLIIRNSGDSSGTNKKYLGLVLRGLFGIYISTILLIAEKLVIQIIAGEFHKKSYEDRIEEQQRAIGYLTILYRHTHDLGRSDTLDKGYQDPDSKQFTTHQNRGLRGGGGIGVVGQPDGGKLIKSALKGVKNVAKSTTTVFGAVASEIAGEQILQPNSASSIVMSALLSKNKASQLGRRIFFSFIPRNQNRRALILEDILKCFDEDDEDGEDEDLEGGARHDGSQTLALGDARKYSRAQEVFGFLDKDENGDCSLEEVEFACLELHRERVALGASMRDLDSAVGRLDSIMMFIWYFISLMIIIAFLDVSFQTMLASAGTLTLGLSWLIGSTAQELLSSIIFLFVKHPYDVGDRVDVDSTSYVVKEMHLLYTVFRQTDGKISQLPHSVLNTKTVVNIRRSGPISEKFLWDVDFKTSLEQIEKMREKMLAFVRSDKRDFLPSFDVVIQDFEGQGKMTLQSDIKYKSNWQNGVLKSQRRNKWITALKRVMAEEKIFGPDGAGDPNPIAEPQLIELVDHEGLGRLGGLRSS